MVAKAIEIKFMTICFFEGITVIITFFIFALVCGPGLALLPEATLLQVTLLRQEEPLMATHLLRGKLGFFEPLLQVERLPKVRLLINRFQ
ncbi:hypothetical protein [Coxiella endosymbiont of Ornithodoros maritimus]|uniref:hypothetical protein n=1 Tax=Coxiella endosymbiont of Ornithodoros maritimus TaxID=1656172 RepID=UPI002264AE73|nr:hypothetical protein [Coxiella endosymbiont of Ornithodoros maritimus]